jgi:Protein of unknown function (DUF3187)
MVISVTNTVNIESRAGEELTVDGEASSLRLIREGDVGALRYRLVLPFYLDAGGRLDSTISHWHRLFGLPQGLRPAIPRDQFNYAYVRAGGAAIHLDHGASGLADIDLELGSKPLVAGAWDWTLWGGLEAPTGNEQALMGNGAWDGAIWFAGGRRGESWAFALNAGLLRPFGDRLFAGDAERLSYFGRAAATRRLTDRWSVRAQLEGGGSRLDRSQLRFLGPSLQFALGLLRQGPRGSTVEFGFVEDAAADTAPDVSFFLSWRQR